MAIFTDLDIIKAEIKMINEKLDKQVASVDLTPILEAIAAIDAKIGEPMESIEKPIAVVE